MLTGLSIIGTASGSKQSDKLRSFSTVIAKELPEEFSIASEEEIELAMNKASQAFPTFSSMDAAVRAGFLDAIADEILALGDTLIERAHLETGLPQARLNGERDRTVNQLRLFASILREGSWIKAVIDTAIPDRKPLPRADIRKIQVGIGPVAVFAASNFPFAFSTAGGDTASALAAGCPVIVKAHTSHLGTNELMSRAIQQAALKSGMPDGVFSSLIGSGAQLGQNLARHPAIRAIGFTGSYRAGMALFRTASTEREEPIPVYAEMSSINPVLLLPEKLAADSAELAKQISASITLGVGQFCTNPGLVFLLESAATNAFVADLVATMAAATPATMLNPAICSAYYSGRQLLGEQQGVEVLHSGPDASASYQGSPSLLKVSASDFIRQPRLQDEVFGPASLLVICRDGKELMEALGKVHGQLTGTVFGTNQDLLQYSQQIRQLSNKVGRLIYNGVPTGVEVCHAMVHGGPFPATTDSRSTSVGAEALDRFLRPICLQDCPQALLPAALQNDNPLGIMRKVNGAYTREPII